MEKIIKVGNVEVIKGLCLVEFNVYCELDEMKPMSVSHHKLYELLDTSTEVKKISNSTNGISFKQGIIKFEAYYVSN
jgi:hypothetical protein